MTPSPDQSVSPNISSTMAVYAAVCELHANEMPATRLSVAEITGLPLTTVDDRIKHLNDHEELDRVIRGQYVPRAKFPVARRISKTTLPDGMTMIEIGDNIVLHLTPKEARQLANDLAGERENYVTTVTVRHQLVLAAELAGKVEKLMGEVRALKERQDPAQGMLELDLGSRLAAVSQGSPA